MMGVSGKNSVIKRVSSFNGHGWCFVVSAAVVDACSSAPCEPPAAMKMNEASKSLRRVECRQLQTKAVRQMPKLLHAESSLTFHLGHSGKNQR